MAYPLEALLSGLPKRERQAFLKLPDDIQSDVVQYIESEGRVPPLRRWPILFGPECSAYIEPEPHGWMLM